jgi:hypothetical protein
MLPTTIAQIIQHGVWKSRLRRFTTFGEYALDQTSDGLGIANNQQLWLLRCAMDVHGKHIAEWADVLAAVEESVKVYIKGEGLRVRDFASNSLEDLSRQECATPVARVTFLPSQSRHGDGHLIRLRRNKPELFDQVVSGRITITDARRKAPPPRVVEERIKRRERRNRREFRENIRSAFLMRADTATQLAVYAGSVDQGVIDAARRAANAWAKLTDEMDPVRAGGSV